MEVKRIGSRDVFSTDRGKLLLSRPLPHISVHRVEGHFESEFVPPMLVQMEKLLAEQYRVFVFNDWELADTYASDVRLKLTQWTMRNRKVIPAVHNLVRSKLLAMGVTVANLALGNFMHVHNDRADFEEALRACKDLPPEDFNLQK